MYYCGLSLPCSTYLPDSSEIIFWCLVVANIPNGKSFGWAQPIRNYLGMLFGHMMHIIVSPLSLVQGRVHLGDQTTIFSPQAEELRWFLLPSEANAFMTAPQNLSPLKTPFFPLVYRRTRVPPSCHTRGTTAKKSQSSEVNEMLSEKVKQCIEQGFTPDFEELKDSGRLSPDDACGVSQETVQYGHQEPQSVTSDDAFGQKRVLTFGLHRENHVPEPGDSIPPDPTSCTKENPNSAVNHIKSEGIAKKCDESEDADQVSHSRQYTAELGGSSFSREDLQSESGKSGSPMATEGSCQKVEAAKRNAVCPDGACFVKRQKVDESANTAAVKHKEFKWHSPPKAIFKPTMEVGLWFLTPFRHV